MSPENEKGPKCIRALHAEWRARSASIIIIPRLSLPGFQKMQNNIRITTSVSLTGILFYGYIPLRPLAARGKVHITQAVEGSSTQEKGARCNEKSS